MQCESVVNATDLSVLTASPEIHLWLHSVSFCQEDIILTDRLLFRLVSGYCVSRLCTQEDDLHFTPVMQRLQKKNPSEVTTCNQVSFPNSYLIF